jgi:uncharacterized phage protein (TIGR02218 family)
MKPTTTALNDLLATRQFVVADLYTFTLIDGTVLYYTAGDANITTGGHTYLAGGQTGPYFERMGGNKPRIKWQRGLAVDTMVFDVLPKDATIEGITFLNAIQQGYFDGATVTLSRAYMATYGTVVGTVTLFVGRVADITCGRVFATFTINSHLELLNQNMPRNVYQTGCVNTLYDAACTLSQSSFNATGSVASGSTVSLINTTSLSAATDYYALGKIQFTSGANNGLWRGVKAYTHGGTSTISLIVPLPNTPAISDTFTIYAGCDKKQSTCLSKFGNLLNFRGFPYIPENSTAV